MVIRWLIFLLGLLLGGASAAQDVGYNDVGPQIGSDFSGRLEKEIYMGDSRLPYILGGDQIETLDPSDEPHIYVPNDVALPFDALGKCDASICGPDTLVSGPLPCFNILCTFPPKDLVETFNPSKWPNIYTPNGTAPPFDTLGKCDTGICGRSTEGFVVDRVDLWSEPAIVRVLFRPKVNLAPVVALLTPGFQVLCTGTAIGPNAILTAAHCACDPRAAVVYFGDKVPATGDFLVDTLHPGFEFPVRRSADDASTSFMAEFCSADDDRRHKLLDLGILRFNNDASASAFIADPSVYVPTALSWTVAGFGVTDFIGATVEEQRVGGLKLSNSGIVVSPCLRTLGENCLPGAEWVSHPLSETTNDTCGGDSGGPLFADDVFVGVTRAQLDGVGTAFCGHGGIYARLDSTILNERGEKPLEWIARVKGETDWKD